MQSWLVMSLVTDFNSAKDSMKLFYGVLFLSIELVYIPKLIVVFYVKTPFVVNYIILRLVFLDD